MPDSIAWSAWTSSTTALPEARVRFQLARKPEYPDTYDLGEARARRRRGIVVRSR